MEEDAKGGYDQDGKHDATRHAVMDEGDDQQEAERGHERREADDAAHFDEDAIGINDDARTLQGDEGEESADARRDGFFQ